MISFDMARLCFLEVNHVMKIFELMTILVFIVLNTHNICYATVVSLTEDNAHQNRQEAMWMIPVYRRGQIKNVPRLVKIIRTMYGVVPAL